MDTSTIPESLLNAPAWRILYQIRISKAIAERRTTKDSTLRCQFLETGRAIVIPGLLDDGQVEYLSSKCNTYFRERGLPPLVIQGDLARRSTFDNTVFVEAITNLLSRYREQTMKPTRLAIIENRCMLRRTYWTPQSLQHSNANNQLWHQDTNEVFGDRPMLTLWIPLQEGCGINRPSLEFLDLDSNIFNYSLGNGSSETDLCTYYNLKKLSTFKIENVKAGDAVVFNGLTFHQTYIDQNMTQNRDALLIRICDAEVVDCFPGATSDPAALTIGA